jgi:non-heme chloroperoxidase
MILICVLLFAIEAVSAIDFSELVYDYSNIPELSQYQARDKSMLDYRYYSSDSKDLLIVIHGSGYHGRYLHKLASEVSQKNIAQVITPDLRGHGINPKKRGDVDYIGQLDDDLDDLMRFSIGRYKPNRIFIAGHSSGGGTSSKADG